MCRTSCKCPLSPHEVSCLLMERHSEGDSMGREPRAPAPLLSEQLNKFDSPVCAVVVQQGVNGGKKEGFL